MQQFANLVVQDTMERVFLKVSLRVIGVIHRRTNMITIMTIRYLTLSEHKRMGPGIDRNSDCARRKRCFNRIGKSVHKTQFNFLHCLRLASL